MENCILAKQYSIGISKHKTAIDSEFKNNKATQEFVDILIGSIFYIELFIIIYYNEMSTVESIFSWIL